jgi:hypothetical protein
MHQLRDTTGTADCTCPRALAEEQSRRAARSSLQPSSIRSTSQGFTSSDAPGAPGEPAASTRVSTPFSFHV